MTLGEIYAALWAKRRHAQTEDWEELHQMLVEAKASEQARN